MSTTNFSFSRVATVVSVLYPDGVIPNWDRAMIEANAVLVYQEKKSQKASKADTKKASVKTKKADAASAVRTLDSVNTITRKRRDVVQDAKTVVEALSKSSGFLTLKRVYSVLSTTGYSRIDELVTELNKLGVVETRVEIPYGRGYARCFSIGAIKSNAPEAVVESTQVA